MFIDTGKWYEDLLLHTQPLLSEFFYHKVMFDKRAQYCCEGRGGVICYKMAHNSLLRNILGYIKSSKILGNNMTLWVHSSNCTKQQPWISKMMLSKLVILFDSGVSKLQPWISKMMLRKLVILFDCGVSKQQSWISKMILIKLVILFDSDVSISENQCIPEAC